MQIKSKTIDMGPLFIWQIFLVIFCCCSSFLWVWVCMF